MKSYLANSLLKESNSPHFIFATLLPPSLYFRHLILLVALTFTSGFQSQSSPQNKLLIFRPHHPQRNTPQTPRLCPAPSQMLLMGPPLLFSCSHNCNYVFMYFVIVMKLSLSGFYTPCFCQAVASVVSILIYAACHCQTVLPKTAVSILPLVERRKDRKYINN